MFVRDPTAPSGERKPQLGDSTVFVQFRVTEPLLLSPFTFGSQSGKQGFYGIQTMNFQMNLLSNANRAWRCVRLPGVAGDLIKNVTIDSFQESKLIFQFLTPRNVVPYYEMPVYRTTRLSVNIPARGNGNISASGAAIHHQGSH